MCSRLETMLKVIFVVLYFVTYVTCKDCKILDECSCSFDDGSGTVDLTSLGNTNNTPRFKDVLYNDEGYYYSYNPCGGFKEGDCSMAAVCVSNQDKSEQQQIGDASKAAFQLDGDNNNVIVTYTSGSGVLRCDKSACDPTFIPNGEKGAGQFEMTLTTMCACPGMCDSSGPIGVSCSSKSGSVLSDRTIVLIAVVSVAVIYVLAGILFMLIGKQTRPNCYVMLRVMKKPVPYDQI